MEPENSQSADIRSINGLSHSTTEPDQLQQYQRKSSLPKIAGILLILAGIISALHWLYITIAPDFVNLLMESGVYTNLNITRAQVAAALNICGMIAVVLSIFSIFGGILAVKKKMFWFALIGGVMGIFAIAPLFIFVPNLVSLIGVVLLVKSKNEFERETPSNY